MTEEITTARDAKRLQKEPFQTKYPPLEQDTVDKLRGWVPPAGIAYVLFERWQIEILPDADKRKTFGLATLDVEGRPEQLPKIKNLINKGFRILHWGNFHFVADKDEVSSKKARMHNNAWATLEEELIRECNKQVSAVRIKELEDERNVLLNKVKEYEKKQQPASRPAAASAKAAEDK